MKRLMTLALSLAMLLTMMIPAARAAEVTPTPPEWVKAEEYQVLSGDPVYEGEIWQRMLRLRADAEAGHAEPKEGDALYEDWNIWVKSSNGTKRRDPRSVGEWFERGLIAMKYAANSDTGRRASTAYNCFLEMGDLLYDKNAAEQSPEWRLAMLWKIRSTFLNWGPVTTDEALYSTCESACESYLTLKKSMTITLADVYDTPLMDGLSAAGRKRIEQEVNSIAGRVNVSLDGSLLRPDRVVNDGRVYRTDTVVVNGRTMVPIRWIAERLGAEVEWVAETQAARLSRAGVQIDMPIGSKTAYKNGVPFQMETAPYVKDGATMIPIRYVAEFFGQSVYFNAETRTVEITEDKSAIGDSNLRDWALPMGAILNRQNNVGNPKAFGGRVRSGVSGTVAKSLRKSLVDTWGIQNREDLIKTVCSMTYHGHNDSFLYDAAMINAMTPSQYQAVLKNAQGMDAYMFPYTKQLSQKWGDRGILCWDLFRMSNLVQWGYVAGYLTYPEALALLEPAATLLHDNFKSWDEAYENYLDGYNWWARNNVLDQNIWETERGKTYQKLKADQNFGELFDNSLFKTPVKGVPGLTAESLLASVQ